MLWCILLLALGRSLGFRSKSTVWHFLFAMPFQRTSSSWCLCSPSSASCDTELLRGFLACSLLYLYNILLLWKMGRQGIAESIYTNLPSLHLDLIDYLIEPQMLHSYLDSYQYKYLTPSFCNPLQTQPSRNANCHLPQPVITVIDKQIAIYSTWIYKILQTHFEFTFTDSGILYSIVASPATFPCSPCTCLSISVAFGCPFILLAQSLARFASCQPKLVLRKYPICTPRA